MSSIRRLFEPSYREVRVDLSGREALVAKKLLDASQIGATRKKLRREGVPHGVRRVRSVKAGLYRPLLKPRAERVRRHPIAARREKQCLLLPLWPQQLWTRVRNVVCQASHGSVVDRNDALLGSLSKEANLTLGKVNVLHVKARHLRDTRASCVEKLKEGPVAHVNAIQPPAGGEKGVSLRVAHGTRQGARKFEA